MRDSTIRQKAFETYSPWVYRPAYRSLGYPLLLALSIIELREELLECHHRIGHADLHQCIRNDRTPASRPDQSPITLEVGDILGPRGVGVQVIPCLDAPDAPLGLATAPCLSRCRCCLPIWWVTDAGGSPV